MLSLMLGNQNDEQDNLHDTPESRLNQNARNFWHLARKLLACEAQ
jgi:hypothetical protein